MWLSSYDSSFECDRPQTLVEGGLGVASCPGPSKGGERAWYTCMRVRRGTPEKCGGNRILLYTLHLSSIELYVIKKPANDHYGNATSRYGDPSACACSVYQAPSPPLEGPGNKARLGAAGSTMVLQQWCAITLSPGVLSLHTQVSPFPPLLYSNPPA